MKEASAQIAKVLIDFNNKYSDKEVFDYIVPKSLLGHVEIGSLVGVPFGASFKRGFVLSLSDLTFIKAENANSHESKVSQNAKWEASFPEAYSKSEKHFQQAKELLKENPQTQAKISKIENISAKDLTVQGFTLKDIPISASGGLQPNFQLKEIGEILHKNIFSDEYLDLLKWTSNFYLSDLLTTLKGVLPVVLLSSFEERIYLVFLPTQIKSQCEVKEESNNQNAFVEFSKNLDLSDWEKIVVDLLKNSVNGNLSLKHIRQKLNSIKTSSENFHPGVNANKKLSSPNVQKLIQSLIGKNFIEKRIELKKAASAKPKDTKLKNSKSQSTKAFRNQLVVEIDSQPSLLSCAIPSFHETECEASFCLGREANGTGAEISTAPLPLTKPLNAKQKEIFLEIEKALKKESFQDFLIHGVTGSGKTEIYFAAANEVLRKGKQVIYLVPEISLTVQLLERVKSNFPNHEIVLWHSNLSDGQRMHAWRQCLENKPLIILGARSAVFAPLNNLGLIIIDEEHDGSYKSGSRPFYDARLIAKKRAEIKGAALISGSATPSVHSYSDFDERHDNSLLRLNQRFQNQAMPKVQIVDMRKELHDGNKSIFSRTLRASIQKCIENKEQVILLLNRRGHSNYVFCRDCGYAVFCDHCSVPMIFHATSNLLHCHHCDFKQTLPTSCPSCASPRIKQTGLGTQKLEQEVKKNFPEAEVIRLDRDISSTRGGVQETWDLLTSKADKDKCQILVGTQLVAKGIDLPRVTLVGVMNSEAGLYLPDFTAQEKTFQLLTQAAGRAGRHDKEGKVIFQTYTPENPIIRYAAEHDYMGFYASEIISRRENNYPPFRKLIRFLLAHENSEKAMSEALQLSAFLKKEFPDLNLLGPAPCPIEKINKLYRWHLMLKMNDLNSLKIIYERVISELKLTSRLNLDIMPMSLM
ncbi:MAG: primosomal protein N' [Candidatus Melainabacteria bacterium]